MRLVGKAIAATAGIAARSTVSPADRHRLAVQLVRELMAGLDRQHIEYMVAHQVSLFAMLPMVLQSAAFAWIMKDYRGVIGMTDDEAIAAVLEARPDMTDLVRTQAGFAWMRDLISGRDLGL